MASNRGERGLVTRESAGIAFAVPPLLLVPLLSHGGLAPILVAADGPRGLQAPEDKIQVVGRLHCGER